uniref:Uncharacterized protein n=1 Tax=Oryza punctata TaxID=4537 RepID=A0A0E0JXB4_ORYPU
MNNVSTIGATMTIERLRNLSPLVSMNRMSNPRPHDQSWHPFFGSIEAGWRGEKIPRRIVVGVASLHRFSRRDFAANPEYGAGDGSDANFQRSLPRAVVKAEPTVARMIESPRYYVAAAGSVPSTAGGDRAHPRPCPGPSEKT